MSEDNYKAKRFADLVGGKVADKNETGADRIKKKNEGVNEKKPRLNLPKFKSKEERFKFYLDYIPALYFVEIEGYDTNKISRADLDMFWVIFMAGVKAMEDKDGGEPMDG